MVQYDLTNTITLNDVKIALTQETMNNIVESNKNGKDVFICVKRLHEDFRVKILYNQYNPIKNNYHTEPVFYITAVNDNHIGYINSIKVNVKGDLLNVKRCEFTCVN